MGRYIILTKSGMRKEIGGTVRFGVCVVGYNLNSRRLERFVQAPHGGPLDGRYVNRFQVMDEVEAEPLRDVPEPPQTENRMIREGGIRRIGPSALTVAEIARCVEPGTPRFMEETASRLPAVDRFDHSVEICRVTDLKLVWENKARPKAFFQYHGSQYGYYRVTDPAYERQGNEKHLEEEIGDAWLIVSIPNVPYTDGMYYKFVAAILRPDPEETSPEPSTEVHDESMQVPLEALDRSASLPSYRDQVLASGKTQAWEPWDDEEDDRLITEYYQGLTFDAIAEIHKRTSGAIEHRLIRIGVIKKENRKK